MIYRFMPLLMLAAQVHAGDTRTVDSETAFAEAIKQANENPAISTITLQPKAVIHLRQPVIYSGSQPITLLGHNAVIRADSAGRFVQDSELTATTQDGALIFNTQANITIQDITVENSATRGIVVNIPRSAQGADMRVTLNNVTVTGSALYGLHIDDNADDFDDGTEGSNIGIDLTIRHSTFANNGTGAIDFDGVRVDERGEGGIRTLIIDTRIDHNGGDGIELDEAGNGDVEATLLRVSLTENGFYNAADLDDGFDIDEAGEGDMKILLTDVTVIGNKDEGLDFDESGAGNAFLKAAFVTGKSNLGEAIKLDEEGDGDLSVELAALTIEKNGDDGIQLTELGAGSLSGSLSAMSVKNNTKYGVKAEQWLVEDEASVVEPSGYIAVRGLDLQANGKGDSIKLHNIKMTK